MSMNLRREGDGTHQCLCILVLGPRREDRCVEQAGPDEPFCPWCSEHEHDKLPTQLPLSKREFNR